ncbi:2',3'-cyclic-nucleotide 3'-phosphodiesterase-like, partial [Argonauta hians]
MGGKKNNKNKNNKTTRQTQLKNVNSNKICPETVRLHFLEDPRVIGKFRERKFQIMFILRGLPGSGKSTLTDRILGVYPNAVVCSADHFLIEEDGGVYHWTPERRTFGHKYCLELADRCCQMKCPIIIIDNTNVQRREVQPYIDMAVRHGYVSILLSPETPWRFDPIQLQSHCSHDVPLATLQHRLSVYDSMQPLLTAWFIAQQDAKNLHLIAATLLRRCQKDIPEFLSLIAA